MNGGPPRDARVRAGIELAGRTLRYAEVDVGARSGEGARPRLLRLGACDFEFDVAEAILDLAGPTHLDTVATAVRQIFERSRVDLLRVAVHPWHATSFFAPLPEAMPTAEKFEQLRQEAAMLADAQVARPVRVAATPLRVEVLPGGRRAHWHHVLRLSESVHARIAHVAKPLGDAEESDPFARGVPHEFVDAAGAAATVAIRLRPPAEREAEVERPEDVPFALSLGYYGDRIEYALSRGEAWHFGHWAEAGDPLHRDSAYFAAALLDRLGVAPASVGRLYVYGASPEPEALEGIEALLGVEARALNPLDLFPRSPGEVDPPALAAFAPCVGAALR